MRIHKYDLLDNKILIIEVNDNDNVPQELRGLICAQFVNRYHRPCAIVAKNKEGFLRGSIRGNDSFLEVPDFKAFLESSGQTEYVQGHANAAGVSIHETALEDLLAYANTHISDEGLSNVYFVDYVFNESEDFGDILLTIAEHPELWGNDIEEPTVVIESIPYYREQLFVMGENKDSAKFTHNGVEFVKFKNSDFIQEMQAYGRGRITVYGKIKKNTWAGRTTPQILIEDYEIEDATYEF
jgi:single-stranded DNA-specific DHH superfamily exonuclease